MFFEKLKYPLLHWILTIFIGSILSTAYTQAMISSNILDWIMSTLGGGFIFLFFGIIFSFPFFIIHAVIYFQIIKLSQSIWTIKFLVNILAILGLSLVLNFKFEETNTNENQISFLAYLLAIIITSLFLKLEIPNNTKK